MASTAPLLFLLAAACAQTWVPPDGTDTGAFLPPGDVAISGSLFNAATYMPLANAFVCVPEAPEVGCVQTSDIGHYQLSGLPDDAHVHVTYQKDGFIPFYWSFPTGFDETRWTLALATPSQVDAWAGTLGLTPDPSLGAIMFKAVDARIHGHPGIQGQLDAPGFDGPVYYTHHTLSPDAQATDDSGVGLFLGVTPGTWDLVYEPPAGTTCAPRWGWSGQAPGSLSVDVVAGAITYVEMECDP